MSSNPQEDRITLALERQPAPRIPADFAARVASLSTPRPQLSPTRTDAGRTSSYVVAALVAVVLLILAPLHASVHANLPLEYVLAPEFAALITWISLRRTT